MSRDSGALATGEKPVIGIRTPVTLGLGAVGLFFGVFGAWAMLAPLDSAAVARGVVSVESQRKTIQHLEGGIVGEIHVRDGDHVGAGQILLTLDETQPRAMLDLLRGRYQATQALQARLIAERDGLEIIPFPESLVSQFGDADVAELMQGQVNIFSARRRALDGQGAILEQRIAQIREEIIGLEGQVDAQSNQIALAEDEISSMQELFDEGLAGMSRLRELQRELAEVTGEHSKNIAGIARAAQNIEATRLEILELRTNFLNAVVEQLGVVQAEMFDLAEQVRSAEDVLARTVVRSSMAGTVVDLQVHTVGGVITPGQELLDIVPSDDNLIVEAFVDPDDIDVVAVGMAAQVRLTALNQRYLIPLEGRVETVSADRLTNDRTGADYFLARIAITDDPARVLDNESLYPGMQAEVMIVTGARTTMDYLSRPIFESMNRAFRED